MLHELHVAKYKNLTSVRLTMQDRTVLYGRNGTGKTNLLEALALIAGDEISVGQIARRAINPGHGAIDVVVTGWSFADLFRAGRAESANALFWSTLGIERIPSSWADAVRHSALPVEVQDAIIDPSVCGVRHSLSSIRGLDDLAAYDRGRAYREDDEDGRPRLERTFDRTLCVRRNVGEGLRALMVELPEPARPLHSDSVDAGDWIDVLTLPPSTSIPLEVVWLSRERTDDELWRDYVEAIDATANGILGLTYTARRVLDLLDWPEDIHDDSKFVARCWFADHAQDAIGSLLPHIRLSPDDDWLTVELGDTAHRPIRLGQPGDTSWFTRLSSGERALVDEALLDAAQRLRADYFDAVATDTVLITEPGLLLDLQVEIEETLEVLAEDYWTRSDVEALITWGKRQFALKHGRPLRPEISVVRVFDEPERHLHSGARSALASALHQRLTGNAVIISTHAAEFLAQDGWDHLHLARTDEGVVVDSFDPSQLDRTHAVARDLGLTSGELLTRYRYVLFVEGVHDEAFFEGYCGPLLRSLGVLVLPMHGADETLQAAQAHLVTRHLDVGLGVLLDHARTRDGSGRNSKEGQLLEELTRIAKRRGVRVDTYRLVRPDIIAYLDDDIMREEVPAFPGFGFVEKRWRQPPRTVQFKDLASELAGGFRFTRITIRDLARRTASSPSPAPADLAEVLSALAEATRSRSVVG